MSGVGDPSPGSWFSPSDGKLFPKNNGIGTDRAPRSRISEFQGQMVVKAPLKNLVMEEVTILRRGEELNPKRLMPDSQPSQDPQSSKDSKSSKDYLPSRIPKSSNDCLPAQEPQRPKNPSCNPHSSAYSRPAESRHVSIKEVEAASGNDLALCATDRLGPNPEAVPLPYAGSVFLNSPSPGSLPFPTSFLKKNVVNTTDLATKGLRYMLRLDLP
ncbi:unnamed protein product [Spirodela intermedia]|uniref:Uncharacterized protein n=1 Tax=Spirodela intermedia TaxID=51605 RepID=A0A7I8IV52_SPIIN|nr:unnamed protein product [Spirodela intermedia]CAA6661649.1 unnamed protein product [Spirodela intermedia]